MKYFMFLFIFFSSNLISGQKIHDFLKKINYFDSADQIVAYDFISKSGTVGLTDIYNGHGYIKKATGDTLGFFHNILVDNFDGSSQHQIYNGDFLALIMHKDKKCFVINLDSFSSAYQLITGNIIKSYRPVFLFDNDYFNSVFTNSTIEKLKIDTLNVFGRLCYRITLKSMDTKDMKNNIDYYYFDAHSFVPLGKKSFFEYAGNKMESSFILTNIITTTENKPGFFNYQFYDDLGYEIVSPNSKEKKGKTKVKNDTLVKNEFSFDKYKGKVLVLDFGYISCPPCIQLIPVMEHLIKDFPEINIIGINPVDNKDKIKKFIEVRNIKYPIFFSPDLAKEFKINSYPETIIFDKEGNFVKRFSGYSEDHYKNIRKTIADLLKN